jgi:hypothetical protein
LEKVSRDRTADRPVSFEHNIIQKGAEINGNRNISKTQNGSNCKVSKELQASLEELMRGRRETAIVSGSVSQF